MIEADFHTHSRFSTDSEEQTRDMIEAAIQKGLRRICLTEHFDPDFPGGEFQLDTAAYKRELQRLKLEYADRIEVLFGVELGLMDYLVPALRDYVREWEFDFVIGSSHLVNGEDPYYPEYYEKYGEQQGILRYFESIRANLAAQPDIDVYGHLDYAVRYTQSKKYAPQDCREVIEDILKALIAAGKGIEINTAGLATLGYVHPHAFILGRYKELGGEIVTVGSDAHNAARVAEGFAQAQAALLAAGFRYIAVFRERRAEMVAIEG